RSLLLQRARGTLRESETDEAHRAKYKSRRLKCCCTAARLETVRFAATRRGAFPPPPNSTTRSPLVRRTNPFSERRGILEDLFGTEVDFDFPLGRLGAVAAVNQIDLA